jgi:SWI/SNF-related matrix-associated actin-dependent regulator 1 of chromatin subfamily A
MADLTRFRGAIFDEAHRVKNPKAQRTQSAIAIMNNLPEDGLGMFLTGTPVLNRPIELVEPLKMLGVISDAPGSRLTTRDFKNRYCWDDKTRSYNGSRREEELAKLLRATVMIRRTKDQVLTDLPPKQRADQWGKLDPDTRKRYDRMAQEGLERAQGSNAEAIVYLNALRTSIAAIKADLAVEWALEFLGNCDKQLVIFAHHIPVQHAIIGGLRKAGYQVTHILGSQKDVEEHKERFQAGTSRVIVCSLMAAGVGHTLTAASDVLMVEQDWTPGNHWQAEDRCHRIGQTDAVTAWYLLAEDTIDQYLFDIVDGKTAVVRGITDGEAGRVDERSTVAYLLAKLAERYGEKSMQNLN